MRAVHLILGGILALTLMPGEADAKKGKNKTPRTCEQLRMELENGLTGDKKGPDHELLRKKKIQKKLRKRCGGE
jgi:hypothetical protein